MNNINILMIASCLSDYHIQLARELSKRYRCCKFSFFIGDNSRNKVEESLDFLNVDKVYTFPERYLTDDLLLFLADILIL